MSGDAEGKSNQPLLLRLLLHPFLMLAIAGLTWAGNHIAARAGAGHVPPLGMASIRWLIGAAILYPFVYRLLRNDWPLIKQQWPIMAILCIGGGAGFSGLQYTALQYTTALNAAIFNSFGPIVIAVAGKIIYRDRLNAIQALGIMISLAGVLTIVSRGDKAILLNMSFNIGDIYLVINMAIWGLYSAMLRSRPKIHPLTFTFALAVTAGVVLFPGFLWEHVNGKQFHFDWLTFWVMFYVSIFPSIVGYICWNKGIEAVGPARGGIFLHLVPVYGVILAILLLGEMLRIFHLAGFVLIISGVWLASRKY